MDRNFWGFEFNSSPDPFNFDSKGTKKIFSRLGFSIAAYIALSLVLILVAQTVVLLVFGTARATEIISSSYFIWGSQLVFMYAISFPVFCAMTRGVPRKIKKKSKMDIEELFMLFFIAQLAQFIGSSISNLIINLVYLISGLDISQSVNDLVMDTPIWIIIIVAVIIGPIFEELIFRRILIDRLSPFGEKFAIVTSAIAFGIFHGNPEQLIYTTALGFVFGYVYSVTRDIRYSIGLHMVFNFFGAVPVMLVYDSAEKIYSLPEEILMNPEALLEYMPELMAVYGYSIVQLAFTGLGIYFLVKCVKQKRFKLNNEVDIRIPRDEIARTFLNPGVITFIVVSIATFVLNLI